MPIDKSTLAKLQKFAEAFRAARERGANESDTVMYLIKFFEEVLGYDSLAGEITKEFGVKDRHCDFAILLGPKTDESKPAFLVEAKAAGVQRLHEKHIEQAENYASRLPVNWVLLTNGVQWQLYHLTFDEKAGITPELLFDLDYVEKTETDPGLVWDTLSVLAKANVEEDALEDYYEQKKLLSPKTIVNTLLGEEVLRKIRQELDRQGRVRLGLQDVFRAVKDVLDPNAKDAAGGLEPPLKKKKRHRRHRAEVTEQPESLAPQAPIQGQAPAGAEDEVPT